MKILKLLCLLVFAAGVANAQGVKFASSKPQVGKALAFEYDPLGTKFENDTSFKCAAIVAHLNKGMEMRSVALKKVGNKYTGEIAPDSLNLVLLIIGLKDKKEEKPETYYALYSDQGKVLPSAYIAEAELYSGMLRGVAGFDRNVEKVIAYYEKGFAADSKLKDKYLIPYLSAQLSKDKINGQQMIKTNIDQLVTLKKPTEKDMDLLYRIYQLDKQIEKAKEVEEKMLSQFPQGKFAYNKRFNNIYNTKDAVKAEAALKALISDFKLDPKKTADANKLQNLYYQIAWEYGINGNNAKFVEVGNNIISKTALAGLYNNFAWQNAEKNKDVEFSAKLSKKTFELIDEAKKEPTPVNYTSKEQFLTAMDRAYAMYADTYALLLHHQGNDKAALAYQEKANAYNDAGGNERYVMYLDLAGNKDKAYAEADKYLVEGKGTEDMRLRFKELHKQLNKPGNVDEYLAKLDQKSLEEQKAIFIKEMTSTPAPTFALMNLKGEQVDLAAQKGKVVILDYWATWCGPCVASFPGMQKAVDKYKNDPNVVFLFINTSQREENREKVVKDFMAANPYTFNVLLDTKSKSDPNKFETNEKYKIEGIPTKFIIDGEGKIRFKKVGFSGSADAVVKELDAMIDLAKNQGK